MMSSPEVSRPKKFFKSKNSSSGLDSNDDFEPIIQQPPPVVPPAKKPPSKFFKSKSAAAPVVNTQPAPLRPLEVTPNQTLKQSLPQAKGNMLLGLHQMIFLYLQNKYKKEMIFLSSEKRIKINAICKNSPTF